MARREGKPLVALTIGDPAGIGPEITLKVLAKEKIYNFCIPIVIGNARVLEKEMPVAGISMKVRIIQKVDQAKNIPGTINLMETGSLDPASFSRGEISAVAGKFSGDCLAKAISLAMSGEIWAVVMPPNNKKALNEGGYHFAGFAEIVQHMTGTDESLQILMGKKYNLARVVNHVPLREVPDLITHDNVLKVLRRLDKGLKAVGYEHPRIGVSALNPHEGEGGLLGNEEIDAIIPAIEDAREEGIEALGPFPADTVFLGMKDGRYDIVLSMHHDHGNACIKLVEFGNLVNFLAGLPIRIFTVSHGTAFDIAGKGVADETNLELSLMAAAGMKVLG